MFIVPIEAASGEPNRRPPRAACRPKVARGSMERKWKLRGDELALYSNRLFIYLWSLRNASVKRVQCAATLNPQTLAYTYTLKHTSIVIMPTNCCLNEVPWCGLWYELTNKTKKKNIILSSYEFSLTSVMTSLPLSLSVSSYCIRAWCAARLYIRNTERMEFSLFVLTHSQISPSYLFLL